MRKLGNMRGVWARAMTVAFAIVFTMLPATAMNVSPMVVEMTAAGAQSTARIQVLNTLSQPLPYEVRIFSIDFDDGGGIVERPADSDFLVFPPQGVVQPGQRQMVRVQWLGGPVPSSRGYYVSINQVPVPVSPSEASKNKPVVDVQMVYHMKVLVTIAPKGAAPKVTVVDARPTIVESGRPGAPAEPGIAVTVTNTGKRYAMLAGATWTITGKDKQGQPLRVVLPIGKMQELLGAGYLPALNGKRTFKVPTGVEFSDAPISVKFSN